MNRGSAHRMITQGGLGGPSDRLVLELRPEAWEGGEKTDPFLTGCGREGSSQPVPAG